MGEFFQVCYTFVRILQNVVNIDVNITFFYIPFLCTSFLCCGQPVTQKYPPFSAAGIYGHRNI